VSILELVIAGLFVAGGLRSLWVWSRRGFEGTDLVDHLLYALYVTGRIGLWFAFAGFFVGWALVEDPDAFGVYALIPIVLAGLQLVTGVLLSREP
jgi:hypothetical protein